MNDKKYEQIERLVDTILGIDRHDLMQVRNWLSRMESNTYSAKGYDLSLAESSKDKDKQQLIGILPYVLLDKKYFPTNNLLVIFAKKNLQINIRNPEKKSRDELLGSIIVQVVKKDPKQIRMFSNALKRIIGKEKSGKVEDFFWEWDKIIKET